MKAEHMVHNANQIALYFAAYPREEAIGSIVDHLKKFWEHRMRESRQRRRGLATSWWWRRWSESSRVLENR